MLLNISQHIWKSFQAGHSPQPRTGPQGLATLAWGHHFCSMRCHEHLYRNKNGFDDRGTTHKMVPTFPALFCDHKKLSHKMTVKPTVTGTHLLQRLNCCSPTILFLHFQLPHPTTLSLPPDTSLTSLFPMCPSF